MHMQSLREPSQSESYQSKFQVLVHNWDSTPGPVYVCVSTQSEHIGQGLQQPALHFLVQKYQKKHEAWSWADDF